MGSPDHIAAIILAAGESKRMGISKIVLPWEGKTVISHIISVIKGAGIDEIVVVTGGYRELVEPEVRNAGARSVFNPEFQNDEMTVSLKIGLTSIDFKDYSGFFFALGDQPMILTRDLRKLIKSHQKNPGGILFPSYKMRRGHPWFMPSRFVDELKRLTPPETLRTFIKRHESEIEYVVVDNPGILGDIDTPEDYHKLKPKS